MRLLALNWYDAIQSREIILLNLAKCYIGAENSQFLGLLIINEVLEAVFRRGKLPANQRTDFSIVIDEVQNYSTPLLSTIISEGRKFGVSLTIANQFLHQLDHGLREAVFGNVGTIAAMRVGVDDAALLAREFYPVFSANDLTNLPRYTTAMKLLSMIWQRVPLPCGRGCLPKHPTCSVRHRCANCRRNAMAHRLL